MRLIHSGSAKGTRVELVVMIIPSSVIETGVEKVDSQMADKIQRCMGLSSSY